jgi:hypothetical protein
VVLVATAFGCACGGGSDLAQQSSSIGDSDASCRAPEDSGQTHFFGASPVSCPDSHDGPAHVAERTGVGVTLEFGQEVDGAVPRIEITASRSSILDRLALPDDVWLTVRGGTSDFGGSAVIAVRASEGGPLLLVAHNDDLRFYEAGLYDSKQMLGVRLEVVERCSDAVDDGCMANETRTRYEVTFEGETTVVLDEAQHGRLRIEGADYDVWLWAAVRVDGDMPVRCTDTWPDTYLDFLILPVGVGETQ